MAYFEKLNYSLSNEDTAVEYGLLKPSRPRVFTIAGSGARVLPLVARHPVEIRVVDLVDSQLHLTELRLAAARALSYEEFLYFMGYRGGLPGGSLTGDNRRALFERLELSAPCRTFWKNHADQWEGRGFILLGRWENHFQKLGYVFRNVLRMNVKPIFEAQSLDEQLKLYEKHWKTALFRNFLRVVASEYVFNRFLYKGHFAGSKDKKTESRAPWEFLDDEFRRLFTTTLVRKNYFLQVLFLGNIQYEEGLPLEAQRHVIEQIKLSPTKVHYHQGDLLHYLSRWPFDFVSLSDTISYLPEDDANRILQKLHAHTPSSGTVVVRSFLRAPQKLDTTGWKVNFEAARWAADLDGTGVYRFDVFEKERAPSGAPRPDDDL